MSKVSECIIAHMCYMFVRTCGVGDASSECSLHDPVDAGEAKLADKSRQLWNSQCEPPKHGEGGSLVHEWREVSNREVLTWADDELVAYPGVKFRCGVAYADPSRCLQKSSSLIINLTVLCENRPVWVYCMASVKSDSQLGISDLPSGMFKRVKIFFYRRLEYVVPRQEAQV